MLLRVISQLYWLRNKMYTIYKIHTGEIQSCVDFPQKYVEVFLENLDISTEAFFTETSVNSNDHYFNTALTTISLRPEMPASISALTLEANGIDSVSILGLPIPCTINIDDNTYEVEDGEFEFTTDLPGIYKIKAESFPYLPKEWEVTAT